MILSLKSVQVGIGAISAGFGLSQLRVVCFLGKHIPTAVHTLLDTELLEEELGASILCGGGEAEGLLTEMSPLCLSHSKEIMLIYDAFCDTI